MLQIRNTVYRKPATTPSVRKNDPCTGKCEANTFHAEISQLCQVEFCRNSQYSRFNGRQSVEVFLKFDTISAIS